MKQSLLYLLFVLISLSCSNKQEGKTDETLTQKAPVEMKKAINESLPTIGILIFEGVIMNEVMAPLDVFSKTTPEGASLFNVVIIAKENKTYQSAQGLNIVPDYTIDNTPELKVLVVPSSYTPSKQTSDQALVEFIKKQNQTTDYIASHCAGAFLIGETGIANDKEIVTYVSGGESLQAAYPDLKVADDSQIAVVEDGKFISSNGNLVSYIASLDLLEKLSSSEQRKYVEKSLLIDRLRNQ